MKVNVVRVDLFMMVRAGSEAELLIKAGVRPISVVNSEV